MRRCNRIGRPDDIRPEFADELESRWHGTQPPRYPAVGHCRNARVAAADTKMHAGVQGKRAIGVDAIRTWPNVVSGDFGIGTGMGSQDQRSPSVFGKILRKT